MKEESTGRMREISNEELVNQLFDLYGNDLKRIAFMYVNDLSLCEDIIQEVFISCYRNLSTFRKEAQYKTWLIRITINKCKDYQRKWSFRNLIYKPIMEPFIHSNEVAAEDVYVKSMESNHILTTISKLPAIYKDILILFYYQDLTMGEICQITNVKLNTVKSRLARGKQLLKQMLLKEGVEYGPIR
ncbi:sigma-70 family RNA polymerase sigma factor [Fredinandcohnia onubensis]|uniref:sigma-70 family RNA polymerase sigma factor n=1 Tax=Fredinandcohnia onubensis TaxID=1571209 RepID=UPI000C0BEA38|nr:sigma-70 family RNA polymerase sigma factor [Fredinandcohnia onubensis]